MFAGHLGAGLLLKRVGRKVNLGWLLFGSLLPDILLWILVLAGIETIEVPETLRTMADLRFDFPYSHSLVASLGWSLLLFAVGWFMGKRCPKQRMINALAVAAAVFSHFLLDWLVHVPELPVAGRDSMRLGFGLWKNLPLAWSVETGITVLGVWVYLKTRSLDRCRFISLLVMIAVVTVMTILGQASNSPPGSVAIIAGSSLMFIALMIGFGWWVDCRNENPENNSRGA